MIGITYYVVSAQHIPFFSLTFLRHIILASFAWAPCKPVARVKINGNISSSKYSTLLSTVWSPLTSPGTKSSLPSSNTQKGQRFNESFLGRRRCFINGRCTGPGQTESCYVFSVNRSPRPVSESVTSQFKTITGANYATTPVLVQIGPLESIGSCQQVTHCRCVFAGP